MGGTSTDVCLILDGAPAVTAEHLVAGYPVRLPSVDIHTDRRRRGEHRPDRRGRRAASWAPSRPAPSRARPATDSAATGRRSPTRTSRSGASRPTRRSATDADGVVAGSTSTPPVPPSPGAGVDAAGVIDGRERGDGAGAAPGVGGARGRSGRPRARRVRRRGTAPRLRARRGDGHVHGDRPGRGRRAVGGRPADRAAPPGAGAHAGRPAPSLDGLDDALAQLAAEARAALGVEPCIGHHRARLPLRRARATTCGSATVAEFPAAHERRNGYRRDDPIEVTTLRAVAEAPGAVHHRRRPRRLGGPVARAGRRPHRRGARGLHHLGPRRAGPAGRARSARSCSNGRRRA